MNDDRRDGFMMIGLHKLAAQNGDGLVPELYQLLLREQHRREEHPNVTAFPAWNARRPGASGREPLGETVHDGKNVVAFAAKPAEEDFRKKQR